MLCLDARRRIRALAHANRIAIRDIFALAQYVRPPSRHVEVVEETYSMRAIRVASVLAGEFLDRNRHITT